MLVFSWNFISSFTRDNVTPLYACVPEESVRIQTSCTLHTTLHCFTVNSYSTHLQQLIKALKHLVINNIIRPRLYFFHFEVHADGIMYGNLAICLGGDRLELCIPCQYQNPLPDPDVSFSRAFELTVVDISRRLGRCDVLIRR